MSTPITRPIAPPQGPIHRVQSEHNPKLFYRVTPDYCECSSFYWGRMKDPRFACKHIAAEFGVFVSIARCCHCGSAYTYRDDSFQTRMYCPGCRRGRYKHVAGALVALVLCCAMLWIAAGVNLQAGHGWNSISSIGQR